MNKKIILVLSLIITVLIGIILLLVCKNGNINFMNGTKKTGKVLSASKIADEADKYYGKIVTGYIATNSSKDMEWQIFHSDGEHIYLIAKECISYDDVPIMKDGNKPGRKSDKFSNQYSVENVVKTYNYSYIDEDDTEFNIEEWLKVQANTVDSIKVTAYITDSDVWKVYKNAEKAEWVIGSPTMELLSSSYSRAHRSNPSLDYKVNRWGYYTVTLDNKKTPKLDCTGEFNYLYASNRTNNKRDMILASAYSALEWSGNFINKSLDNPEYGGFRPVVCLKSNIQLEELEDETYIIK